MSEGSNRPDAVPNKLPPMRTEEVIARAQRILDRHGKFELTLADFQFGTDPYRPDIIAISEDELALINEFLHYWRPFIKLSPKSDLVFENCKFENDTKPGIVFPSKEQP